MSEVVVDSDPVSVTFYTPVMSTLAISGNGRYLTKGGTPFLIVGDTPWTLEVQLTRAQITQYLNDRQAKGFTAILFEAIEHAFSDQSPPPRNAEGNLPFTTMSFANSTARFDTPNDVYWQLVDYIVSETNARGMLCFITPAYYGANSSEGWQAELGNDTSAHLQAYGAFLANRYGNAGNIVWVVGGDSPLGASYFTQIMQGMRTVRTDQIVTGHSSRGNDGYSAFSGVPGFNFNTAYTNGTEAGFYSTAYGRGIPFVHIEGYYEGDGSSDAQMLRRQIYGAVLGGGCGSFFGNQPLWDFGSPAWSNTGQTPQQVLDTTLNTAGAIAQGYAKALFAAYNWWLLVPQPGATLVTTSLGGTGTGHIYPALASDGSFAMVYKPSSGAATINMAAFSVPSVRARFYDPTTGTYSTVTGSPFANSGTQSITWPGERILVLDSNVVATPAWASSVALNTWISPVANWIGASTVVDPLGFTTNVDNNTVQGVITDYTGMLFDDFDKSIAMVAQGGHNGYAGNEVYRCDLSADTPVWVRRRNATARTGDSNSGYETWTDGRPTAFHGYTNCVGAAGRIIIADRHGINYNGGSSAGWWEFSLATNDWISLGNNPPGGATNYLTSGSCACYDPVNNRIIHVKGNFMQPCVTAHRMTDFAIVDSYSNSSYLALDDSFSAAVDSNNGILAIFTQLGIYSMTLSNLAAGFTLINPSGGVGTPRPRVVFDKNSGAYYTWNGGQNISKFTPVVSGNRITGGTWSTITCGGVTVPSPGSPSAGIYGKIAFVSFGTKSFFIVMPRWQNPDVFICRIA